MRTRNEISCEEVQHFLLEQNISELDDRIRQHLESCEKCREFHGLLIEISNSTQIAAEENLQPDTRILRTLKENFEASSTPVLPKHTSNLFETLVALFRRRIPVYQVIVAVFIAAIFYFSYSKTNFFKTKPEQPKAISHSENQTIRSVEFPVQPRLDQDQQVGKSLAEDSVLAKFRVSIL